MIRNLGIGAFSGLALFAAFIVTLSLVASCDERPVWVASHGEAP